MKIFITGASGLLGSKIVDLYEEKHIIYAGYNKHPPDHSNPIQIQLEQLSNISNILAQIDPEVIIHCAALTNVDYCETHPELASQINTKATKEIALFCKENHTFLVYISTDYVFQGNTGNYLETDQPNPINHYGRTKLESESLIQKLVDDYCIARTSVIYGAHPATGKENFALWLYHQLNGHHPVNIITDQWNSPTLNSNLADMIIEIVNKRFSGILHTAGGNRINRYDFAKKLAEEFKLPVSLIKPIQMSQFNWKAQRPIDTSLNTSLASQVLTSKPQTILESMKQLHEEINKIS